MITFRRSRAFFARLICPELGREDDLMRADKAWCDAQRASKVQMLPIILRLQGRLRLYEPDSVVATLSDLPGGAWIPALTHDSPGYRRINGQPLEN